MFRIRIRLNPGFFADPDSGFKSLDPFINKLMESKWCFWLGFGGPWPKRVLNMKFKKISCTSVFGRFLSWIRFFCRSGSGPRKKSLICIRKETPDPKHCILVLVVKYYWFFSLKPTILKLFTVLYCNYYFLNKPVPYFSICHQKLCKEL